MLETQAIDPSRAPIFILGMHRSGTSCLAALLQAAGAVLPGPVIRNWDNPHGHHEALTLLRLNEDVLATSGAHWLRAPERLRWTPEQAVLRDQLLSLRPAGGPALWKDPRSLLTWPFWQAGPLPLRAIGVIRHPLAVARSLLAWRARRTRPWLLVGWCWYLVSLLPVVGIVKVGDQLLADRYSYLPQIGLWIMLAFELDARCWVRPALRRPLTAVFLG
ncbi:MAG TPA: hypothetical protein PKW90_10255, partial [Myxococcota bacterium]|nr:hypothetical protein [Myxococcota bacterium]